MRLRTLVVDLPVVLLNRLDPRELPEVDEPDHLGVQPGARATGGKLQVPFAHAVDADVAHEPARHRRT